MKREKQLLIGTKRVRAVHLHLQVQRNIKQKSKDSRDRNKKNNMKTLKQRCYLLRLIKLVLIMKR